MNGATPDSPAVPEPATMGLFGATLVGIGATRYGQSSNK